MSRWPSPRRSHRPPRRGWTRIPPPHLERSDRPAAASGHGGRLPRRAAGRSAAVTSASWPRASARRCSSTTRPISGPAAGSTSPPSAPTAWPTPARRSCAGPWSGWWPRRASTSTSPPAASSTWPSRPGFPPARIVFHGNNKSDEELAAALGRRRRPDRGRLLRRARPARGAGQRRNVSSEGDAPGDARRRGPHPRVHRDRHGGLEVRLPRPPRRRPRGGPAGGGQPPPGTGRAPLPHRLPDPRAAVLRRGGGHRGRPGRRGRGGRRPRRRQGAEPGRRPGDRLPRRRRAADGRRVRRRRSTGRSTRRWPNRAWPTGRPCWSSRAGRSPPPPA